MAEIDVLIKALYNRQPKGLYLSESEFRSTLNDAAAALFKDQPASVELPEEAFKIFLISLQQDYGQRLDDIKRRLFEMKRDHPKVAR